MGDRQGTVCKSATDGVFPPLRFKYVIGIGVGAGAYVLAKFAVSYTRLMGFYCRVEKWASIAEFQGGLRENTKAAHSSGSCISQQEPCTPILYLLLGSQFHCVQWDLRPRK